MNFSKSKKVRFLLGSLLFFAAFGIKPTQAQSNPVCSQKLPDRINELLTKANEQSRWGIVIESPQEVLYKKNADQYFMPASNLKLLTTATALQQLDSSFKITTPVHLQGNAPNLEKLQIIGQGDPTLQTEDLEQLADNLAAEGIRSIDTLTLEQGYFSKSALPSSWEWGDLKFGYATAVTSLILDENTVTLELTPQAVDDPIQTTWNNVIAGSQWDVNNETTTVAADDEINGLSLQGNLGQTQLDLTGELPKDEDPIRWDLAIPNPDRYIRDTLLRTLRQQGIAVEEINIAHSQVTPISDEPWMTFSSPPLTELITEMNHDSHNLYAEALLRVLIEQTNSDADQLEGIQEQLTTLDISPKAYQMVDGSGLSRWNLVTPSAIAQLLQGMLETDQAAIFRESLPVAGKTGTLSNRFEDTALEGKLQAKTGTLTGVSALSGYLDSSDDQPLVFSIFVNHSQLSASQQRELIDEMVLLLSRLEHCS